MQSVKIKVDGMTCGGCVKSVQQAVNDVNGIQDINVSLEEGIADVTYDNTVTSAQNIVEEIEAAGFDASIID